jgi:hypothetical protein
MELAPVELVTVAAVMVEFVVVFKLLGAVNQ